MPKSILRLVIYRNTKGESSKTPTVDFFQTDYEDELRKSPNTDESKRTKVIRSCFRLRALITLSREGILLDRNLTSTSPTEHRFCA